MSKTLVILGALLVITGLLWSILPSLGLGSLPGDFFFEKKHFKFYIPITTSLIVSGLISIILWLLRKY